MTADQLMTLQRLIIFRISKILIPVSISAFYVRKGHQKEFEWHELRIFGVLVAMWGTIG